MCAYINTTRLLIKPWTIIHGLRQQILNEHLNLAFFEPPTPFFTCYTLIAIIPLLLHQLKSEDGQYNASCLEKMSQMTINACRLSVCMMPEAFAEPVIHQVIHWAWVTKAGQSSTVRNPNKWNRIQPKPRSVTSWIIVMRLIEFKVNVSLRCFLWGILPENEREEVRDLLFLSNSHHVHPLP